MSHMDGCPKICLLGFELMVNTNHHQYEEEQDKIYKEEKCIIIITPKVSLST